MIYSDHLVEAARYAVLALSAEPPGPDQMSRIGPLRDDVVINLTDLVTTLACRVPVTSSGTAVSSVARDPVGAVVSHLAAMHRLAPDWDQRPGPHERYAGRPRHPWQATAAVLSWQGLGAETLFAAHEATRSLPDLSERARWGALHDVAVLTQAFACLEGDLASQTLTAPRLVREATQRVDGVLALKARELAVLAGATGRPDGSVGRRPERYQVVPVSRLATLPDATTRLEHLLLAAGPTASAQDLMAAAIALAKASVTAARALDAGAGAPDCAMPERLRATATVLHAYSRQLHTAILDVAPRLASLHESSAGIGRQAGEIGGEAARRMLDLVPRPAAAEAASPDLLEFAARLAAVTGALAAAVDGAHRSGRLYVRDRSTGVRRGWAPSRDLGRAPLSGALATARRTAGSVPASPAVWTPSPSASKSAAMADLMAALRIRQSSMRPSRPGAPRWGSPPVPPLRPRTPVHDLP